MAADLEGQRRAVGIADVDPQAVLDVDDRDATIVHVQAVEAAVVDGDPPALVEPHDQVRPGDQGVGDADVGAQVASNDDIGSCCEGALGSLVPHGQHRRGWWAHEDQLYRPRRRLRTKSRTRFTAVPTTAKRMVSGHARPVE
jgi:hypothetical protein